MIEVLETEDGGDLRVSVDGGHVEFSAHKPEIVDGGDRYPQDVFFRLTPEEARVLARRLNGAAGEIAWNE